MQSYAVAELPGVAGQDLLYYGKAAGPQGISALRPCGSVLYACFADFFPAFFARALNRSTRPAVSITFSLPV